MAKNPHWRVKKMHLTMLNPFTVSSRKQEDTSGTRIVRQIEKIGFEVTRRNVNEMFVDFALPWSELKRVGAATWKYLHPIFVFNLGTINNAVICFYMRC